ncbi:hypothetical protein [Caballeronia grimmiae]|uniref:hypothetical protein n=1 Tax=Caballeronia grimmiae TaxID=1071679 RepID=UPI0038B8AEE0
MTPHLFVSSSKARRTPLAPVAAMVIAFWAPFATAQSDAPGRMSREHRIVAPANTDPFVVRRNANAKANAEYRASKQMSKRDKRAAVADAQAHYKEEVTNARINRKADRDAANNTLKATELDQPDTPRRSH